MWTISIADHCVTQNYSYSACFTISWMITITVPVIIVLGTLGNVLAIAVLLRKTFRSKPSSMFLLFLAITDGTHLMVAIPTLSLLTIFGIQLNSSTVCRSFVFVANSTQSFSVSLMSLISMERVIAIKYPIKAKILINRQKCIVVALLSVILIVFVNGICIFTSGSNNPSFDNFINMTDQSWKPICLEVLENETEYMMRTALLAVVYLIPLSVLVVSNIIIIRVMLNRKITPASLARNMSQAPIQNNTTKICVVLTVVYFLTNTPFFAFRLSIRYADIPISESTYMITDSILAVFLTMNQACNVLLYYWSGSTFRDEFSRMKQEIYITFNCKRDK